MLLVKIRNERGLENPVYYKIERGRCDDGNLIEGLQEQLKRAEPCKNGMSNQYANFFPLQQISCDFVLGSSYLYEDKRLV